MPKGGIARFYGRAKVYKSGPVYEEVWRRLVQPEKDRDPQKHGHAVLIEVERAGVSTASRSSSTSVLATKGCRSGCFVGCDRPRSGRVKNRAVCVPIRFAPITSAADAVLVNICDGASKFFTPCAKTFGADPARSVHPNAAQRFWPRLSTHFALQKAALRRFPGDVPAYVCRGNCRKSLQTLRPPEIVNH